MSEELTKSPDFRIACCNLCTQLIRNKLNNLYELKSSEELLSEFRSRFHLTLQLNEIFEIAKEIYKENLANDKYGVNKLTEAVYE